MNLDLIKKITFLKDKNCWRTCLHWIYFCGFFKSGNSNLCNIWGYSVLPVCLGQWNKQNCVLLSNRNNFKKEINISNRRKGKCLLRLVFEFFYVLWFVCLMRGFRASLRKYGNTYPKSCEPWFTNLNNKMFHESESNDISSNFWCTVLL